APEAVGGRVVIHDASPWRCVPRSPDVLLPWPRWPRCVKRWLTRHAARMRYGRMPRRCARCSVHKRNAAAARNRQSPSVTRELRIRPFVSRFVAMIDSFPGSARLLARHVLRQQPVSGLPGGRRRSKAAMLTRLRFGFRRGVAGRSGETITVRGSRGEMSSRVAAVCGGHCCMLLAFRLVTRREIGEVLFEQAMVRRCARTWSQFENLLFPRAWSAGALFERSTTRRR